MRQLRKWPILCTILISCLLLGGCHTKKDTAASPEAFDSFLNEIFLHEVQSDSITLNYTLDNPKEYGITDFTPTLGEYSISKMKENSALTENYRERLKSFSYKSLSKKQQETYDVLMAYFDLTTLNEDMLLYSEVLGPTTGIQAQLPVLLSEYPLNDKADIEDYLSLLSCVKDYFSQINAFEKEKAANGLFMSDDTADQIINQCQLFIDGGEKNALIDVFNDRINKFSWLTEKEKKQYQKENKKKILKEVIPAYKLLIKGLKNLKGSGQNEEGLCQLPKGKEYYEYLIHYYTGSSKSMAKIRTALKNAIDENILKIQDIARKTPDVIEEASNVSYPLTNPEEILNFLKEDIKKDYPALPVVDYTVKYVHDSLEEYLSPAFYLSPAIDNYSQNCIYINQYDVFDMSDIFTTLAHEGYPGHLYQNVYYAAAQPAPIRSLLNFSGYSEGWASYAELDSYNRAGLLSSVSDTLAANRIAAICMYSYVDLNINYYNWSYEDTKDYLKNFGIKNDDNVTRVYSTMVEEPGNYLKYAVGYLEIMELQQKAEKSLKNHFDLKEFRKFFLDFGPAPFDVLEKHMNAWIREQK